MSDSRLRKKIYQIFGEDVTGHDAEHIFRVERIALKIAELEKGVALEYVSLLALCHEVGDRKFWPDADFYSVLSDFFSEIELPEDKVKWLNQNIPRISYSKGMGANCPEVAIVQDADRIDAIGAIGIARCFATGAWMNQPIYRETDSSGSSLEHFNDKLFKLCGKMNTESGRRLARERHEFLEQYYRQFLREWYYGDSQNEHKIEQDIRTEHEQIFE
jgi:uncharacterized protein